MTLNWRPLPTSFYRKSTLDVASGLLGKTLVRRFRSGSVSGRIVEVEAYIGEDDPACHAFHGRTARTDVMYGPPGRAYVYFTYGMHYMLNVVTEDEGFPAAVLIRALEPLTGLETMRRRRGSPSLKLRRTSPKPKGVGGRIPDRALTTGPARLCAAFGIDLRLNRCDLRSGPLFIAMGDSPPSPESVSWTSRVGIRNGLERRWRCFEEGNPFVSKGRPGVPPSHRRRR